MNVVVFQDLWQFFQRTSSKSLVSIKAIETGIILLMDKLYFLQRPLICAHLNVCLFLLIQVTFLQSCSGAWCSTMYCVNQMTSKMVD